MRILQIAPTIGPGTGVGAVAHNLEREWSQVGVEVDRFTLEDARGGWLPAPGPGLAGKLALAARVVWFSTVGTVFARREIARVPGRITVCHNDVLAGDVYVNHGIVQASMKARGSYWLRMVRNPMHLFIALRDRWRYHGHVHQLVVNLVDAEEVALREVFPHLAPPTVTIGNGVDVDHFRPPTPEERHRARAACGIDDDQTAIVFIGHEFDRKGLPIVLAAMQRLDESHRLVVVGGTSDMVAAARAEVVASGLDGRVEFVGAVADALPLLHAADVFAFPSAYESYGLVVLEALACGVPVVATPVGCVPEVVRDGVTGAVVDPTGASVASAITDLGVTRVTSALDLAAACREVAEARSWSAVAATYLSELEALAASPRTPTSRGKGRR